MDEENIYFCEYSNTLTLQDGKCYLKKIDFDWWDDIHRLVHSHSVDGQSDRTGHHAVARHLTPTELRNRASKRQEKLRAYKSLDASNFVLNWQVQDLQYRNLSDDFCVMWSLVLLPGQRQGQKTRMHQAWAIMNRISYILAANWTSMAR